MKLWKKTKRKFKNNFGKIIIIGMITLIGVSALINLYFLSYPTNAEVNVPHKIKLKEVNNITINHKQHKTHKYLTGKQKEWVLSQVSKAGLSVQEAKCLLENESSWDAEGKLINSGGKSVDRGLWAINDYWHYEVSNACAYDIACSTKEAIRIRKQNGNWNQWVGYVNNCI